MEKIEELWVIEKSGICLFNHKSSDVDETLFSGFLSSLQSFIETIGGEQIKKIEMGDSKLLIFNLDEYNIFLCLRSSQKTKDKYLKKKMTEIQNKFIVRFGSILVEHQVKGLPYDDKIFEGFHQDLKIIFEENIDKQIKNWMKNF